MRETTACMKKDQDNKSNNWSRGSRNDSENSRGFLKIPMNFLRET